MIRKWPFKENRLCFSLLAGHQNQAGVFHRPPVGLTNCPWRLSPISTFTFIIPKRRSSFSCFATAKVGLRTDTRVLDFCPWISLHTSNSTWLIPNAPLTTAAPLLTSPLQPPNFFSRLRGSEHSPYLQLFPTLARPWRFYFCNVSWPQPPHYNAQTSPVCKAALPRKKKTHKIKPTLFLIIITESKFEGKYILEVIPALG